MGAPQAAALGLELLWVKEAQGALRAPWREDLVGDPETGIIAGGVVTTLLDHVCGMAALVAIRRFGAPTLDLRIDYMRPAEPGLDVLARAHCYKLTRSVAFVRAVAYDRDPEDPVATAQAAFMLDSSAGKKPGANLKPSREPRAKTGSVD